MSLIPCEQIIDLGRLLDGRMSSLNALPVPQRTGDGEGLVGSRTGVTRIIVE